MLELAIIIRGKNNSVSKIKGEDRDWVVKRGITVATSSIGLKMKGSLKKITRTPAWTIGFHEGRGRRIVTRDNVAIGRRNFKIYLMQGG